MEITIKIDGQAVSVEVSYEVYECLCESDRKAENLFHQKCGHWDARNFDEYIIATECIHIQIPTPEDILCHRETICELMAVLASCTETQQERFLLYALEGMSFSEIACPFCISRRKNHAHYQSTQAVPHYTEDIFIEVSDEVYEVILLSIRQKNNYDSRMYYHKAHYPLVREKSREIRENR